jgi:gephyrin
MATGTGPISVEEAIRRVMSATTASTLPIEHLSLSTKLLGRTLAAPLISRVPFPHFRASIMDGYAVQAPLTPGIYRIVQEFHAGDLTSISTEMSKKDVSYIATGAKVPDTANAVVKIEETRKISDTEVEILCSVQEGDHIRAIGSDIALGEEVLPAGTVLTAIELGLLATTGFTDQIACLRKTVIGVMSTGNELVDPATPDGSLGSAQIRDSNRITLIAALEQEGHTVLDLGIMPDDLDVIRDTVKNACHSCDILITSGGVSMGQKDFMKALLLQDPLFAPFVTLHFNLLNMKPGKPTTFATLRMPESLRPTFLFALPGNPVSCMVTKSLFVDVAIRRLQGASSAEAIHSEVYVTLAGDAPIKLDPERSEYHRVSIVSSGAQSQLAFTGSVKSFNNNISTQSALPMIEKTVSFPSLYAFSTGNQRSSRLLSMRAANGLLCLPQGPGNALPGQVFRALLIGDLPVPIVPEESVHARAACADLLSGTTTAVTVPNLPSSVLQRLLQPSSSAVVPSEIVPANTACCSLGLVGGQAWKHIRVGIVTISDRASSGEYKDDSGPEIAKILTQWASPIGVESTDESLPKPIPYPLHFEITQYVIVPDNPELITSTIADWTAPGTDKTTVDLLLTTGGTGFGPRDFTPETVSPLLHRPAPGIAQALLQEGLKYTPLAVLARPVAGTRHQAFIVTLPGR